jgi:hypothetical protein
MQWDQQRSGRAPPSPWQLRSLLSGNLEVSEIRSELLTNRLGWPTSKSRDARKEAKIERTLEVCL